MCKLFDLLFFVIFKSSECQFLFSTNERTSSITPLIVITLLIEKDANTHIKILRAKHIQYQNFNVMHNTSCYKKNEFAILYSIMLNFLWLVILFRVNEIYLSLFQEFWTTSVFWSFVIHITSCFLS